MSTEFVPGGAVQLSASQYQLRTLGENDVSQAYVDWLNDPEVNAYLAVRFSTQTMESTKSYVRGHDNRTAFLFGIFAEQGTRHIGNFSLMVKPNHEVGILGVMVGDKAYWGESVVQEGRTAILNYCFGPLALAKVHGACYSDNRPAIYNYRRQGWQLDGIQKKHVLSKGRYVDMVNFAMFKEEWLSRND